MLPGLLQPHLHTYLLIIMRLASIISYSDYWKAVVAYTWHIYASGSCELSAVATKDRPGEDQAK